MSRVLNDCTDCDLKHRCGRYREENKDYICQIGGPYEVLNFKEQNERKLNEAYNRVRLQV